MGDIFPWLLWFLSDHGMPEDSGIRTEEILGADRQDFRMGEYVKGEKGWHIEPRRGTVLHAE